jgi:hypothetical protein
LPSNITSLREGWAATASATQLAAIVKKIRRAADRDAVIADAQRPRACGADQVEGDLQLVVAAEIAR